MPSSLHETKYCKLSVVQIHQHSLDTDNGVAERAEGKTEQKRGQYTDQPEDHPRCAGRIDAAQGDNTEERGQ